jgi:hypothetical protein
MLMGWLLKLLDRLLPKPSCGLRDQIRRDNLRSLKRARREDMAYRGSEHVLRHHDGDRLL